MTKLTKMWAQAVQEQAKKPAPKKVVSIEEKKAIVSAVAIMPKPEPKRRKASATTDALLKRSKGREWAAIYQIKYGRK